jgi:hypothetical protein
MHVALFSVQCNTASAVTAGRATFQDKRTMIIQTSGISFPVIRRRISGMQSLQPHSCGNLRTRGTAFIIDFGRDVSEFLTKRAGSRIFKVIRRRGIFPGHCVCTHSHGYSGYFGVPQFAIVTIVYVCTVHVKRRSVR